MDNRERYRQLLKAHGITQAKSAVLITAVTTRPCSERTVRSWLNDPDKPSSSPCPAWAVAALEKAVKYMQQALAQRAQAHPQDKETPP
jgi:hypothetical protein